MNQNNHEKPEPPLPHECCGGGSCCPCVWDTYYEELRQWQASHGKEPSIKKPRRDPDASSYR